MAPNPLSNEKKLFPAPLLHNVGKTMEQLWHSASDRHA
jgi:hypothetical protein